MLLILLNSVAVSHKTGVQFTRENRCRFPLTNGDQSGSFCLNATVVVSIIMSN